MTVEIANALRLYFETLYNLNRNLIKCCGLDATDRHLSYEKPLYDVIDDIPRLIPYACDKTTEKQIITERNGLLEFSSEIPYLKADYEDVLISNNEFLYNIRLVRNKLEHRMHGVKMRSSISGTCNLFDVLFEVQKDDEIKHIILTAGEFIKFTKQLNNLFSKLQSELSAFADENGKADHPYYERLLRYDFRDFNKIYESNLLRTLGQTLFPF